MEKEQKNTISENDTTPLTLTLKTETLLNPLIKASKARGVTIQEYIRRILSDHIYNQKTI